MPVMHETVAGKCQSKLMVRAWRVALYFVISESVNETLWGFHTARVSRV